MPRERFDIRLRLSTQAERPVVPDAVRWGPFGTSNSPHGEPVSWQIGFTANAKALVIRVRIGAEVRDFTCPTMFMAQEAIPAAFDAMKQIAANFNERQGG